MAKVDYRKFPSTHPQRTGDALFAPIRKKGFHRELENVFRVILTESEITMLSRRMLIIRKLLSGEPAERIKSELHVGLNVIHFIDRQLQRHWPEYRSQLPLLLTTKHRKKTSKVSVPAGLSPWRDLRRKYPLHFLLVNMLLGDPRFVEVEE